MDFKQATDLIFRCVSHAELAERIGCSVAAIRQARLRPDAAGYRSPPAGWEKAVSELAEERAVDLTSLRDALS